MEPPPGPVLPPPPLPDGTPATRTPEQTENLRRFQCELEFVQCLANPMYLHELFMQGILEQEEMLNYFKYLEYWRAPEYVRFIVYPTCLVYLTLVQQELFRSRLGDPTFVQDLVRQGQKHHETW
ncbi:SOH1-domain-containing protein [Papiliotrema laurentii]|uniref:Mediator of RNA polymerase II transcription subunit 31 n=1 Tax=Papiliotrema laurentii TaxID=5418 RepID=A0AAD9L7P8_PAPLA|nr:SOH1-domain-containing protein [Papiliotrema laurentii]